MSPGKSYFGGAVTKLSMKTGRSSKFSVGINVKAVYGIFFDFSSYSREKMSGQRPASRFQAGAIGLTLIPLKFIVRNCESVLYGSEVNSK
jgi:hypothetical protein